MFSFDTHSIITLALPCCFPAAVHTRPQSQGTPSLRIARTLTYTYTYRIDERSVSRRYHAVAAKPCLARRLPRTVEAAAERESTSATASATAAVAPTMAAVEPADAADGRDCGGQKSSAASTSRAVFWLGGVVPTSTARFGRLLRGVETASSATRRARSASAAAAAVAWFALRSAASSACAASASATRRACSSWMAMSAKRELA